MKLSRLILVSSFLLFTGCLPKQSQTLTHNRPQGFWENKRAIVQIWSIYSNILVDKDGVKTPIHPASLGTGVVIDKQKGLIITNYHVIVRNSDKEDKNPPIVPEKIQICPKNCEGSNYTWAEIVALDKDDDLALLRTNQIFPMEAKFVNEKELVSGDEVYLWGNVAFFLPVSPFVGNFVGISEKSDLNGDDYFLAKLPLLILDINVTQGSSGGAVFNGLGQAVGIVNAYEVKYGRALGLAIPWSTIKKFVEQSLRPPPKK